MSSAEWMTILPQFHGGAPRAAHCRNASCPVGLAISDIIFPKIILLPDSSGLKWIRIVDDIWLPDPSDPRGVKWLRTLQSRKDAQWSTLVVAIQRCIRQKTLWDGDEGALATLGRLNILAIENGWD